MSESVESLYRESQETVRASFGMDAERALDYYAPLLKFVSGVSPPARARRGCWMSGAAPDGRRMRSPAADTTRPAST